MYLVCGILFVAALITVIVVTAVDQDNCSTLDNSSSIILPTIEDIELDTALNTYIIK